MSTRDGRAEFVAYAEAMAPLPPVLWAAACRVAQGYLMEEDPSARLREAYASLPDSVRVYWTARCGARAWLRRTIDGRFLHLIAREVAVWAALALAQASPEERKRLKARYCQRLVTACNRVVRQMQSVPWESRVRRSDVQRRWYVAHREEHIARVTAYQRARKERAA